METKIVKANQTKPIESRRPRRAVNDQQQLMISKFPKRGHGESNSQAGLRVIGFAI